MTDTDSTVPVGLAKKMCQTSLKAEPEPIIKLHSKVY